MSVQGTAIVLIHAWIGLRCGRRRRNIRCLRLRLLRRHDYTSTAGIYCCWLRLVYSRRWGVICGCRLPIACGGGHPGALSDRAGAILALRTAANDGVCPLTGCARRTAATQLLAQCLTLAFWLVWRIGLLPTLLLLRLSCSSIPQRGRLPATQAGGMSHHTARCQLARQRGGRRVGE